MVKETRGEVPSAERRLSHELIVCTLGRPEVLDRCISSVAAQSLLPDSVRVVDASRGEESLGVVSRHRCGPLAGRIVHQPEAPGLTRQRNAGIRASSAAIIHFVDDDTVLERDYLRAILGTFTDPAMADVLGVGGLVTNVHRKRVPILKRLFLLDGTRPGRVLRSGRNQLAVDLHDVTEVDWLSGCSMSFRREVFERFSFNEDFQGYGLGEDVELTYRIAQEGRLVVNPAARLAHLQSELNRLELPSYTHDELVNRAVRVRAGSGRLSMGCYWWSVLGQLSALAVVSATKPASVERERLREAMRAVREVLGSRVRRAG